MTAARTAPGRAHDPGAAQATPNGNPAPLLWVDGRRADPSRAAISAFDRGFTLGDGVFETMRIAHGAVFRLDRHLERLAAGASIMGLAIPEDVPDTIAAAANTAFDLGWADAALRLTLTRGVGARGVAPPVASEPVTVLTVHDMPPAAPIAARAVRVRVAEGRRNEFAPTAGVKTLSYADNIVALSQARAAGADDALFLDTAGHLSEATASNIFLVSGSMLRTPPRSCGILPGVTRAAVLELAAALQLAAREEVLETRDLADADEAFLTSAIRGIAPIASADDRSLPNGAPGPITARLAAALDDLVARECRQ